MKIKIDVVRGRDIEKALLIRKTVFVEEQGVNPSVEFDGTDDEAEHVLLYLDDKPIGCARVRYFVNKAKLERIAILKDYRGKGFGKALTEFLVDLCRRKGMSEIYIHSQVYVEGFYKKIGFKERGAVFNEAGIPHIEMYMIVR